MNTKLPETLPPLSSDFAPVSYDKWRKEVERTLGADFDAQLVSQTHEGISIQPIYAARHITLANELVGFPGIPPYVRGTQPVGSARDGWKVCHEFDDPDRAETTRQIRLALERGVNFLWLRFDLATRLGYDADTSDLGDAVALGGVPVVAADDLWSILAAAVEADASVALDAGGNAVAVAALLVAATRDGGIPLERLRGSFCCDPLGALVVDGTVPTSLETSFDEMVDLAVWTAAHAPNMKSILVSATPYHDAGANAVQELGIAIATGLEYLRRLTSAGVELETATNQILFAFSIGRSFFLEIAKLRAARLLWAKVVSACGGSADAQAMTLHARGSSWTKTRRDPWVNILRGTSECFAAAVAGADSVAVVPFDTAAGGASELGHRLASNTQNILREESQLHRVADPAGGSWYVEKLTHALARQAWGEFQAIEADGGMAAAILDGSVRGRIERAAREKRERITTRRDPITGVSEYPNVDEDPVEVEGPDLDSIRTDLRGALEARRTRRDQVAAAGALRSLDRDTVGSGALTEAALAAASAGATIGSISALVHGSGDRVSVQKITVHRASSPFDELRDGVEQYVQNRGTRPKVFLANVGPVAEYKGRVTFAANLFGAGGLEAIGGEGYATLDAAVEAFAQSGARAAVICSTDANYPSVVPALARELKQHGAQFIALIGNPGDHETSFRDAGVDCFLYRGCDAHELLSSALGSLGVVG